MLISSFDLYQSDWLDVVFENRNKSYGAYILRSEASGIQLKALFIGILLFVLLSLGWVGFIRMQPEDLNAVTGCGGIPPVEEVRIPKERMLFKPKYGNKAVDERIKLSSRPVIVKNPLIIEPALQYVPRMVVRPLVQPGLTTDLPVFQEKGIEGANAVPMETVADPEVSMFESLELYPEFEGGMDAWTKFLQKNLKYPALAEESCVQGRVFVSFVIGKDGMVTDARVIRGLGAGCDEEAIRVIRKSPRWKAGMQNGKAVRVRYIIPVSFTILG